MCDVQYSHIITNLVWTAIKLAFSEIRAAIYDEVQPHPYFTGYLFRNGGYVIKADNFGEKEANINSPPKEFRAIDTVEFYFWTLESLMMWELHGMCEPWNSLESFKFNDNFKWSVS